MTTEEKVLTIIKEKQKILEDNLKENSQVFAEGLLKEEKPDCIKDMLDSLNKVANSARTIETLRAKISILKEVEKDLQQTFQNGSIDTLVRA